MSPQPPTLESALTEWLPQQRWYPAKGRRAANRVVGGFELPVPTDVDAAPIGGAGGARAPLDDVSVTVHLVELQFDDGSSQLVQVPLVARAQPVAALAHALVGRAATPSGVVRLYDGPQDPAYVAALLHQLAGGHPAVSAAGPGAGWARGVPGVDGPAGVPTPRATTRSRVLRGEQSNTSVIVDAADDHDAVIVKVFRTLQPGANPDIVLQRALAAAGSERVPRVVGWVEGGWDDSQGRAIEAHLAFASEFLAGSEDAFRVATKAVEADRDFADEARELGAATAEVHRLLAEVLPTEEATPARLGGLAERLAGRARWATEAVATLAPWGIAAVDAADEVRRVAEAPRWQRIHGDYHLGQVLRPPGRGWVLLDFEGEPLVPLTERVQPECPLRDVAGMLRSFGYAARRLTVGLGDDDWGKAATARAETWESSARDAFCAGYGAVSGRDPREYTVLLRAFELDKALYEVVYESRNRPGWLPIPLGAVERLLG